MSHGTASTMVNKLGEGGNVRKNGKIIQAPLGGKGFWVDFGNKKLFVMSIPWGDVSTAYFTTGIPNIETYAGVSRNIFRMLQLQPLFNWVLRTSAVRNFIKKENRRKGSGAHRRNAKQSKEFSLGTSYQCRRKISFCEIELPGWVYFNRSQFIAHYSKNIAGKFVVRVSDTRQCLRRGFSA